MPFNQNPFARARSWLIFDFYINTGPGGITKQHTLFMQTHASSNAKAWHVLVVSPQHHPVSAPLHSDCIITQVHGLHSVYVQYFSVWQQQGLSDWFVLPVAQLAGSKAMSATYFEGHFMPAIEALLHSSDAVIRQGGLSLAADEVIRMATSQRIPVYDDWKDMQDSLAFMVLEDSMIT